MTTKWYLPCGGVPKLLAVYRHSLSKGEARLSYIVFVAACASDDIN